jgi:hypothetical protein
MQCWYSFDPVAHLGQVEVLYLVRLQDWRAQERHEFVKDGCITGDANVMASDEWQKVKVVGNASSDPASARRVPPVLNVALLELPGRRPQDMRASLLWSAVDNRHCILKLVAEPICPARLVETRSCPHAAGERLIQQPSVQQHIERCVRRTDLDCPQDAIPERLHIFQHRPGAHRVAIRAYEGPGIFRARGLAEQEDDLLGPPWREFEADHDRGTGVSEFTRTAGQLFQ